MTSPRLEPAVLTIFPMSDTVYIKLLIRIYSLFGLIRHRGARQEMEILYLPCVATMSIYNSHTHSLRLITALEGHSSIKPVNNTNLVYNNCNA
jgi:hypothetical protein